MRRTTTAVLLSAAVLAVVAGCGAGQQTVTGTVSVPAANQLDLSGAGACTADDGYDDVEQGAQVTVTDQTGTVLGIGSLGAGRQHPGESQYSQVRCQFTFSVRNVSRGAHFYQVHVGNSNRGDVKFAPGDLSQPLALTIG